MFLPQMLLFQKFQCWKLQLKLDIPWKIFKKSQSFAWICSSQYKLIAQCLEAIKKAPKKASSSLGFQTCISKSYIWTIITFTNNAKIILILLGSLGLIASYLESLFFAEVLASNRRRTIIVTNLTKARMSLYPKKSLSPSFDKTLMIPEPL